MRLKLSLHRSARPTLRAHVGARLVSAQPGLGDTVPASPHPGSSAFSPFSSLPPLAHGLGATPLALAVAEGTVYAVGFDDGYPEEMRIRRLLSTLYVHQRVR